MHSRQIKSSAQFNRLNKLGQRLYFRNFVISFIGSNDGCLAFGVIASKKVGSAVKRNRCKRVMRALIKDVLAKHIMSPAQCIVIARPHMLIASHEELKMETSYASKKISKMVQNALH